MVTVDLGIYRKRMCMNRRSERTMEFANPVWQGRDARHPIAESRERNKRREPFHCG